MTKDTAVAFDYAFTEGMNRIREDLMGLNFAGIVILSKLVTKRGGRKCTGFTKKYWPFLVYDDGLVEVDNFVRSSLVGKPSFQIGEFPLSNHTAFVCQTTLRAQFLAQRHRRFEKGEGKSHYNLNNRIRPRCPRDTGDRSTVD